MCILGKIDLRNEKTKREINCHQKEIDICDTCDINCLSIIVIKQIIVD